MSAVSRRGANPSKVELTGQPSDPMSGIWDYVAHVYPQTIGDQTTPDVSDNRESCRVPRLRFSLGADLSEPTVPSFSIGPHPDYYVSFGISRARRVLSDEVTLG